MALDKVIDSAVLDADLLAVADAIRAKGGTGAALAFPAGFVEAIQAITAGGGDGIQSASGTYVLAEETADFKIDINDIGFVPDIAVVQLDETGVTYDSAPTKAWALYYVPELLERVGANVNLAFTKTNLCQVIRGAQGTNTVLNGVISTNYVGYKYAKDPTVGINLSRSAASYPIIAGTYKWSVYKIWGDE